MQILEKYSHIVLFPFWTISFTAMITEHHVTARVPVPTRVGIRTIPISRTVHTYRNS